MSAFSLHFRQASERAHNVKKVDDRVNKVIAAPNRAANAARVAGVAAMKASKATFHSLVILMIN